MTTSTVPTELPDVSPPAERLDDLAQIIAAYNDVTEKLQSSHESLSREVVRLQRELASTDAQLQRSKRLAALGEMAAGIAHEIRNPLAAIQLYLDMLRKDLPEQTSEADLVRKVISAARGMEGIVTDVLTFARELHPDRRRLVAADLLERVIDSHRPIAESRQVSFEIDGDTNIGLFADSDLLYRALLNVIRNAVEAVPEKAGIVNLHVSRNDSAVSIRVRDNGCGIDEQDIDRIFNPFFTTRNTGTGLGLAIVHRIVDAHGGTITAVNNPSGGAVFELSIPHADDTGADV